MKSLIALLILVLFFGCSAKKTDKELFDEAQTNLSQQKFPEAVISFDELIDDYPESKLTPEALSQLASIYQNRQIKNLSEKESLEKAVQIFKKLHDEYPESEYAPSGLFMAGFINANDLHNYDAATILYNQFLKEYPNDELAASAQAELDNMGVPTEEWLEKQITKEK